MNADDVDALRSFGSILAKQLVLHPDDRVSYSAKLIAAALDDFYRFGQRIQNTPVNMHLTSSHATVFMPALLYIDSTLDTFQIKARLVRHRDFQFREVLDYAYKFLSQSPLQLRNIISSEEGISSRSMGLQIADLAAGITARVLNATYKGRSLKPDRWAIWKSLRGSLLWGDWSYQLTSDDCETRLASIWKGYTAGPWYEHGSTEQKIQDNPMKCNCGQVISSGRIRDFYLHVIECHPEGQLIGFPCGICKEIIPFGLGACHQVREHGIKPPLRGDSYGDMQNEYEVLLKIREMGMKIVVPRDQSKDIDMGRTD